MTIPGIVKGCGQYFQRQRIGLFRGENMGYRIVYGPEVGEVRSDGKHDQRIRVMTAAFLLLSCLLTRLLWPEGAQMLRDALLPGQPSVTEQAFSILAEQLRAGEPVGEAVESFCRFVIVHGAVH